MRRLLILMLFLELLISGCGKDKFEFFAKTKKGELNILDNGDYVLKVQNRTSVFKKVRALIWFNDAPYFELDDGRIMKWDAQLSTNAIGLQKIGDKLYFLKQHGDAAWEGTSLYTIDKKGNIQQVRIQEAAEQMNVENYNIFYGLKGNRLNTYIIVNDMSKGYCVARADGSVIQCYPWPDGEKK